MSFNISFFARDVHTARTKLSEVHAPAAVKAVIELAIAGIPPQPPAPRADAMTLSDASKEMAGAGNRPTPRPPRLAGILVETHGHIDESGSRSNIGLFRVEPYYD